ncbi:MAG: hypothetical protein ABUK08_00220 [Candidatus Humimicrobiaceae bacterium]
MTPKSIEKRMKKFSNRLDILNKIITKLELKASNKFDYIPRDELKDPFCFGLYNIEMIECCLKCDVNKACEIATKGA